MGCSTRPYNLMPRKRGPSNRPEDAAALEVATPPRRPRPWPRISNAAGARAHHSLTPMCPLQLKGISKHRGQGWLGLQGLGNLALDKAAFWLPHPALPWMSLCSCRLLAKAFPGPPLPFLPHRPEF